MMQSIRRRPAHFHPRGHGSLESSDAHLLASLGIGRVTLSRRERLIMVEPRDAGMVLNTLRAARPDRNNGHSAPPRLVSVRCARSSTGFLLRRYRIARPLLGDLRSGAYMRASERTERADAIMT